MTQRKAVPDHPLAWRMAAVSFLTHNLMIGSVFGVYGLLITTLEQKTGMTRDASSLGIPVVLVGIAVTAPMFGVLVGRVSIRLLMMLGALLMMAGFSVLAIAPSMYTLVAVYALLIGPATSLNSTMLPTTLVTRWFSANRGRALGIVNMPILAIGMPPVIAQVLTHYGLSVTYFVLAALGLLILAGAAFVVDHPPAAVTPEAATVAAPVEPGIGIGDVLRTGRFWALSAAFAALTAGASARTAHLAPLAMGWGIDATRAASLISIISIGGIAGGAIWGTVADRIGGARTLALLCLISGATWALLLLRPPYVVMAAIVVMMGLATGAVVAVVSVALAQLFGRTGFGRAYGVCNMVNLPITALGVPATAHVYVMTGSYTYAIAGLAACALLGAFFALAGTPAKASS